MTPCTHPLAQFQTDTFGLYGQITGRCGICGVSFTRPLVEFDEGRESEISEILNIFHGRVPRTPAERVQHHIEWGDDDPADYDEQNY